jgi:hypothetical protein
MEKVRTLEFKVKCFHLCHVKSCFGIAACVGLSPPKTIHSRFIVFCESTNLLVKHPYEYVDEPKEFGSTRANGARRP